MIKLVARGHLLNILLYNGSGSMQDIYYLSIPALPNLFGLSTPWKLISINCNIVR